jgi:hypothetical protein
MNYGTKLSGPFVHTAIEAVEMSHYFRWVFSAKSQDVRVNTEWYERANGAASVHEFTKNVLPQMPSILQRCELILWEPSLFDAAISGCRVFMDQTVTKERLIPDGKNAMVPQLWFLKGSCWDGSTGAGDQTLVLAKVVFPVATLRRVDDSPDSSLALGVLSILGSPRFPFSDSMGLDTAYWDAEHELDEFWAQTVAALEFMSQPIVRKEREQPPRQYRRHAERRGVELPTVYTIRLRHQTEGKQASGNGVDGREYHCQWLVGAHWRNQYYPSEGRHKPVYILPYVKGDPSKPFKPPGEKVYAVVR